MKRMKNYSIALLVAIFTAACQTISSQKTMEIVILPDSVLNDLSKQPIGMNLNFLMDGARFPHPKQTVDQAMSKMGMKYLRYPGGEKSDLYLFSIPPFRISHTTLARTAGLEDYPGMFTKDHQFTWDPLDFDEYVDICRKANAEPVVVVAADYYLIDLKEGQTVTPREKLIEHAAAWVNYANKIKGYDIKYWMIGNESWNKNNKNSTVDIYAQDVIDFSKAMKAVDPSILIIPNGDSDQFFKTVMTKAGDYIDRICVSNYGVYDFINGFSTYRDSVKCLIWPALTSIDALNKYASPEQLKKWKVIVAEFGTIDWFGFWKGENDMGHAIVAFDMAGQLMQQPQIEFSCYWNTRWIENEIKTPDHDVLDKNGNILPTGHALSIWGNFMAKQMVKTTSANPLVNYSTFDPSNGILYVYIINKSDKVQAASLEIEGYKIKAIKEAWEYFGQSPEDKKPVWQAKEISKSIHNIQLKGTSISVFQLNISR